MDKLAKIYSNCSLCHKNPIELWFTDRNGSKMEEGICRVCDRPKELPKREYGKMEKRSPRSKSANQHDAIDTMQPWKKQDGKVVENDKFYQYYGGDRADDKAINPDPERATFMKKKYPKAAKK